MKTVRRPREIPDLGCHIDFYYQQFSEATDSPDVTVHVDGNAYDCSSPTMMRRQAKFMMKAADWLEDQDKRGKIK